MSTIMSSPPIDACSGAPVVIALHCSGGGSRQWRTLADTLGAHCTMIAPDLIGSTASGPWWGDTAFSLDAEAAPLIRFIKSYSNPVHLVGHSYGGGLALHVAAKCPHRVASLSLYEPSAFHLLRTMGPQGRAALQEIKAVAQTVEHGLVTGHYREAAERFVEYWNGVGSWARMKPHAQTDLIRYLPKASLDFRALLTAKSRIETYRYLDVPTLLVQGEAAPRPTALLTKRLHAVARRGSFKLVRGAGHMGPLTHPFEVAEVMAGHILAGTSSQNAYAAAA